LHAVLVDAVAPRQEHGPRHGRAVEAFAERDEALVRRMLLARELGAGLERLLGLEVAAGIAGGRQSGEAALEDLEVEPIHGEDVVQRGLDRREEARASR